MGKGPNMLLMVGWGGGGGTPTAASFLPISSAPQAYRACWGKRSSLYESLATVWKIPLLKVVTVAAKAQKHLLTAGVNGQTLGKLPFLPNG